LLSNLFGMTTTLRTDSNHPDFIALVKLLDADLAVIDGEDHSFYDQYNKIDSIKHALVLYNNDEPVACGALKEFAPGIVEVKRMFTAVNQRNKGLASKVLIALEDWAKELGYEKCILETGKRQPDAIALYQKNGYHITPNYGQYQGVTNSVCFEKKVNA